MNRGRLHYAAAHLRRRPGQAVTAGVGIVVAAAGFSLLTASASTNQVRTQGQVASSFRAVYDVLVRPPGTQTPLEQSKGLVRPNFESGISGGISLAQWSDVLRTQGVEVAAPIAYLGYPSSFVRIPVPVDRFLTAAPEQLLRLRTASTANSGLSRYPGSIPYVFVTADEKGCDHARLDEPATWPNPFAPVGPQSSYLKCFSRAELGRLSKTTTHATVEVIQPVALLTAAIDPEQENKLVGLDPAVLSGRPLSAQESFGTTRFGATIPVLAAATSYIEEPLQVSVERVDPPAGHTLAQVLRDPVPIKEGVDPPPGPNVVYGRVRALPGKQVGQLTVPSDTIFRQFLYELSILADPTSDRPLFTSFWSAGPVTYRTDPGNVLTAVPVRNPPTVYSDPSGFAVGNDGTGYGYVPVDNADTQFRQLTNHAAQGQTRGIPGIAAMRVVGTFDPTRLARPAANGSAPLNQVPLEAYAPPLVQPADPASRRALSGKAFGPTANVGGYVSQPPALLTTLAAARGMTDPRFFTGGKPEAPISVIRVRVAGVTGPDKQSLERIRRVATAITTRTGLQVDITAGSSPEPQLVQLPAGDFGRPPLLVSEGWSRKGVAVVILSAVDAKSAALFALILAVTLGLLANAATAAVRSRRREIGILLATGWAPRHIFGVILGELGLVGALAGMVGAGLAGGLVAALHLELPAVRVLLVPPVALAVALLAGFVPAVVAARGSPSDVVLPAVSAPRRRGSAATRRMTQLAARNLRRRPGRAAVAAGTLLIGVAGVTALLGINIAYQDLVTGTRLGDYVATAARTVDYLAVALALLLAGISIANTLVLDQAERAPELATLQATGWAPGHLARLTVYEATGLGLLGSVPGAVAGAMIGLLAGAPLWTVLILSLVAATGGTVLAAVAGLVAVRISAGSDIALALGDG